MPKEEFLPQEYGGTICKSSTSKCNQERVPSRGDQDRHHQAQVEYAQGKGMILIGFNFYRSRNVSCETGLQDRQPYYQEGISSEYLHRIVRRELKPLHHWHHLSWFLSMRGFRACVILHDKLQFIENGLHMPSLLRFRYWRIYRFIFYRQVKTFLHLILSSPTGL